MSEHKLFAQRLYVQRVQLDLEEWLLEFHIDTERERGRFMDDCSSTRAAKVRTAAAILITGPTVSMR